MTNTDFNAHFNGVQYCHQRAGAKDGPSWAEARFPLGLTNAEGPAHATAVKFTLADACPSGFVTLTQKDMRLRGAEKYFFVGIAIYGPLDDKGGAAQEVIRAQLESDRDLVLPLPPNLEAGEYVAVAYNPDRVVDRDLFLVLHTNPACLAGNSEELLGQIEAQAAAEGLRKAPELPAATVPTKDVAFAVALATALTGPDVEYEDYDDLQTSAAFTPSGGYVLAAKAPGDGLEVDFDFGSSEGLTLLPPPPGASAADLVVTVQLGNEWRLVAEFAPLPGGAEVSVGMELAY